MPVFVICMFSLDTLGAGRAVCHVPSSAVPFPHVEACPSGAGCSSSLETDLLGFVVSFSARCISMAS